MAPPNARDAADGCNVAAGKSTSEATLVRPRRPESAPNPTLRSFRRLPWALVFQRAGALPRGSGLLDMRRALSAMHTLVEWECLLSTDASRRKWLRCSSKMRPLSDLNGNDTLIVILPVA